MIYDDGGASIESGESVIIQRLQVVLTELGTIVKRIPQSSLSVYVFNASAEDVLNTIGGGAGNGIDDSSLYTVASGSQGLYLIYYKGYASKPSYYTGRLTFTLSSNSAGK